MNRESQNGACPLPTDGQGERILLAHGEGGRLMRELIQDRILPILGSWRDRPDELFQGNTEIKIDCPRCGAHYPVTPDML